MINKIFFCLLSVSFLTNLSAAILIEPPQNLISPPAAQTEDTIVLLWDKPADSSQVAGYEIHEGNRLVGETSKGNFTVSGLPNNISADRTDV